MENRDSDKSVWVRKMISLSPHTAEIAQKLANKWYAGNLSAFIASRIEHTAECERCAIDNSFKIRNFKGVIVGAQVKPAKSGRGRKKKASSD